MTSRPVYTSKAEGFRTAEEIEAMRPVAAPKPRAPGTASNPRLRQVTNGIACFCGERFGEHQALEFMLHLRAEVGDVLKWREHTLSRERIKNRERNKDPEYRRRKRESQRERMKDPEYRERQLERMREYRKDPQNLKRKRELDREYRARKKAEREAQG